MPASPPMAVWQGRGISEEVESRSLAGGPSVVDVVAHLEPDEGGWDV